LKLLTHTEVDKGKWERLLLSSLVTSIYNTSWYLDASYPHWQALVWEKEGRYVAAMILPIRRILFFKLVQQPYFVQQTGLIWEKGTLPSSFLNDFIELGFYKRFVFLRISFNSLLLNELIPFESKCLHVQVRKNFVLDLGRSYQDIYQGFNDNRKRNLKKAISKGLACELTFSFDEALEVYKNVPGYARIKETGFAALKRVYKRALELQLAELYVCKDEKGKPLAYTLFVRFEKRLYYLFGAMTEEGKSSSAISLAFDTVIKKYAGQEMVLDFEGGSVEGIGAYFASFGAVEEVYPQLTYQHPLLRHRLFS
jgi:hypothetical protein